MKKTAPTMTATVCATVVFASVTSADPTPGNFVNVKTPSPTMRCEIGSDDSGGAGPNVVCQTAGFPGAPIDPVPAPGWQGDPSVLHQDQAIITAAGRFSWRTANLGVAPPGQPDVALVKGTTYHFKGWTIVPTADCITFTNDATGHGMSIDNDYNVKPV